MDNEKTIIVVLAVIIVILIVGIFMFSHLMAKEDSIISISDNNLTVGDPLVVKLTDSKDNPISNEIIKIELINEDGKKIDMDITTNSKGKAQLKVDEKGKYSVECKFDGNNYYASSSNALNITVKSTTKLVNKEQTSKTTHKSKYAPDGGIYPEYGPYVDSNGITREYAIANDMHYLEYTVDGDRPGEVVTVGGYTARDPNNGLFHS